MTKSLYIAEKPSVAVEFANALHINPKKKDGYIESQDTIITWCVGHLVSMSYPEKYGEQYKSWNLHTLPFVPNEYKYEIIPNVSKQFSIVKSLLTRDDVSTIYVCTDSGREGEYIYRLVEQMADVKGKVRKRVWIDSQTEEEILKGINNAKDLSEYDNLSASAYLRAKEDYLMGINFSRVLTLKYGRSISNYLGLNRAVIAVGRVMTCVLGMVVARERDIRDFVKIPFFRVLANVLINDDEHIEFEWKALEKSLYYNSPDLYKDCGFLSLDKANELIERINNNATKEAIVDKVEKKKENKYPPLLYNLAELQNECSKLLKISPDETLKITQELYEKKLVTYPRTDARVLSTAVAKEIKKNIVGLLNYNNVKDIVEEILQVNKDNPKVISRYVNDKKITDHYAIIPTGQGIRALSALSPNSTKVYDLITRRFLSIFYPEAVYQKLNIMVKLPIGDYEEMFNANFKILVSEGYLKVINTDTGENSTIKNSAKEMDMLKNVKKGDKLLLDNVFTKEGETSPPKRYNSGSIILAMENAGQLIEDEELREQIKGSGIGTSATRSEILKKLISINYISLNKKTQMISPTQMGEMVYDVVNSSIKSLLNPELTASWEKGLTYVYEGSITPDEYMDKLKGFVIRRVEGVKNLQNQKTLSTYFDKVSSNYK